MGREERYQLCTRMWPSCTLLAVISANEWPVLEYCGGSETILWGSYMARYGPASWKKLGGEEGAGFRDESGRGCGEEGDVKVGVPKGKVREVGGPGGVGMVEGRDRVGFGQVAHGEEHLERRLGIAQEMLAGIGLGDGQIVSMTSGSIQRRQCIVSADDTHIIYNSGDLRRYLRSFTEPKLAGVP